jgi:acyl-CoA dehydrogenase
VIDQGFASPFYGPSHIALRDTVRKFVETEILPFIDDWIKQGKGYPKELHIKAYKAGIAGLLYPNEYGGTRPKDFDAFHELIMWDELARSGGGGVLGQMAINSMALPPIIHYGSQYLKELVLRDVVEGRKFCSLMISEPTAGSDVANIKATAERVGNYYRVNGLKKWITGGHMADVSEAEVYQLLN